MALLNITTNQDGVPVVAGVQPNDADVASYIIQSARRHKIDPQTALTVWSHEGRGSWQSNAQYHGSREKSYGPFQLFKGGGLGNEMQTKTGLDPADPKNWRESVDFAMDHVAANKSWKAFHGAAKAGIVGGAGIGQDARPYQPSDGKLLAQNSSPMAQQHNSPTYKPATPVKTAAATTTTPEDKKGTMYNPGKAIQSAFQRHTTQFSPLALESGGTGIQPDQYGLLQRLNFSG